MVNRIDMSITLLILPMVLILALTSCVERTTIGNSSHNKANGYESHFKLNGVEEPTKIDID